MASRITRTSLVQAQRQFAAQAAHKKLEGAPASFQTTKLPNGLLVATSSQPLPLATVGVMVKSASRYETYESLGCSHALRAATGLATKNHTAFGLVRNVQQAGSQMTVTQNREYTLFCQQALGSEVGMVFDYLLDAVANPAFKPWELAEMARLMKLENAELPDAIMVTELLHEAAYRQQGLGNPLICPEHLIGKHSPKVLANFFQKTFTSDRCALVGVGVNHDQLCKMADALPLDKGAGPSSQTKYFGGEARLEKGGRAAYVAIAAECAPGTNSKETFALAVLKHILGTGPRMEHGNGSGKLQKAVGDGNHAVSGIHFDYSDSGLIGAYIAGDAESAGECVSKVAAALRSLSITDEELKAAKKSMSILTSEYFMNGPILCEMAGELSLLGGSEWSGMASEKSFLDLVNGVTLGDVQAVAKKLSNAKFSMAAVGNLSKVPHVDSL